MPDVVVAVPTYRRPKGLERLLCALEQLDTDARVVVLVADNDAQCREGVAVCDRIRAGGYRWPLEAIVVAERGIAQCRNALVEHALSHADAQFVAMLDDDEWPEPQWLDAFLRVQEETGADALHGSVVRDFETAPGAWAAHCAGIAPLRGLTGPIDMIHGTSNVFLRRGILENLPRPFFHPGFALTGGEDKEFFTRLARLGTRFAWADDAVAHDHVPSSRARIRWALQRAYRTGNSDMRVFLLHCPGNGALLLECAKIAGMLVGAPVWLLLVAAIPARRMAALCKIFRTAGKTAAMFGAHYNEYAVVHGV